MTCYKQKEIDLNKPSAEYLLFLFRDVPMTSDELQFVMEKILRLVGTYLLISLKHQ